MEWASAACRLLRRSRRIFDLRKRRTRARYMRFRSSRRHWDSSKIELPLETESILKSMYASEPQMGTDCEMHVIDKLTRISHEEGLFLKQTHQEIRPALSVEVGLAYGFSAVYILSAMKERNYGHHIAIDPFKTKSWHGVGVQKAMELGMDERFEFIEEYSANALLRLAKEQRKAQFIFIDGGHRFDNVIVNFLFADKICDLGGWIILDDLWMPSVQKTCDYVESNRTEYEPCPCPIPTVGAFRKVGEDCRDWRHYVDF